MRRLTRRIREIARWPRRYRTSRGFGVHSPFAFDFITKVLRDREAYYYAYPEIDSLCGKTHRDGLINNMIFYSSDYERQEARMLFRMLCRFNPAQVIEIGGGNEVSRIIIERAIPSAALHRWSRENPTAIDMSKTCFIIVNYTLEMNFTTIRSYLLDALDHPGGVVIFFRNMHLPTLRRLWEQVAAAAPFGMTFHDDVSGVYVANPKLPREDFEMLI